MLINREYTIFIITNVKGISKSAAFYGLQETFTLLFLFLQSKSLPKHILIKHGLL